MKRKSLWIIVTGILLVCAAPETYADYHDSTGSYCYGKRDIIAQDIISREFSGELVIFEVKTNNDVMYDAQEIECMQNIVILIQRSEKMFYTIFHVHYDTGGKWIEKGGVRPKWEPMANPDGWRWEWCALIETVYPAELNREGCKF